MDWAFFLGLCYNDGSERVRKEGML